MKVRFYESSGEEKVAIHTGYDGKDEVHRVATEEDKKRHAAEYAAFRPPLPAVVAEAAAKPIKKQKE